ncbi:TPA: hypothetical protein ACPWFJ_003586 [Pseudomonas aeruginosa]
MSVSTPLEIQRRTKLDAESTKLLRTFDLEWRCGTRLIHMILEAGFPPQVVGQALVEVLVSYQKMCRDRTSDFIRLREVLGHVLAQLRTVSDLPSADQVRSWCDAANVPPLVREYLAHG